LKIFLIEWPVMLPYLMAMASLTAVVAMRWLAGVSTGLTTAAT
jgi:VIT1/CCC1 family predicted Fe2+/Mn2+ transporter